MIYKRYLRSIYHFKDFVINKLKEKGIKIFAKIDSTRPTTNKNSFYAQKHKLIKIDTVNNNYISEEILNSMIADLKKEDSIKLQDIGVGTGRLYGCGIFLPHKSLDAVANFKED